MSTLALLPYQVCSHCGPGVPYTVEFESVSTNDSHGHTAVPDLETLTYDLVGGAAHAFSSVTAPHPSSGFVTGIYTRYRIKHYPARRGSITFKWQTRSYQWLKNGGDPTPVYPVTVSILHPGWGWTPTNVSIRNEFTFLSDVQAIATVDDDPDSGNFSTLIGVEPVAGFDTFSTSSMSGSGRSFYAWYLSGEPLAAGFYSPSIYTDLLAHWADETEYEYVYPSTTDRPPGYVDPDYVYSDWYYLVPQIGTYTVGGENRFGTHFDAFSLRFEIGENP